MVEGSLNRGNEDPQSLNDQTHELDMSKMKHNGVESPVTDFVSAKSSMEINSNERRLLNLRSPKSLKLKLPIEDLAEHTMNITNHSTDGIYSPKKRTKPLFISKFVGKALVVILWLGLMTANMICVTQME